MKFCISDVKLFFFFALRRFLARRRNGFKMVFLIQNVYSLVYTHTLCYGTPWEREFRQLSESLTFIEIGPSVEKLLMRKSL